MFEKTSDQVFEHPPPGHPQPHNSPEYSVSLQYRYLLSDCYHTSTTTKCYKCCFC